MSSSKSAVLTLSLPLPHRTRPSPHSERSTTTESTAKQIIDKYYQAISGAAAIVIEVE